MKSTGQDQDAISGPVLKTAVIGGLLLLGRLISQWPGKKPQQEKG